MLANNLIAVFLGKEYNPILNGVPSANIIKFCYPVLNNGHHWLRAVRGAGLLVPPSDLTAPTCCLTCLSVVNTDRQPYGKLMLYCDTCQLRQPDEVQLYWPAREFRGYLVFFLNKYYGNVNLVECLICQTIEQGLHLYTPNKGVPSADKVIRPKSQDVRKRLAALRKL